MLVINHIKFSVILRLYLLALMRIEPLFPASLLIILDDNGNKKKNNNSQHTTVNLKNTSTKNYTASQAGFR